MRSLLIILSAALVFAEWPIFRGDGALSGTAVSSIPDRPVILWSHVVGKKTVSSPVIARGVVCIGGDGVFALSVSNGKRLWSYPSSNSFDAPPLIYEGSVYIGDSAGTFHAFDLSTGSIRWRFSTGEQFAGSANAASGKGLIVAGCYDNTLYAFDAQHGRVVWKFETDNYINGAPAVSDGRIAFGGCDGNLHVLSYNGEKRAAIDVSSYIPSSPAIAGTRAYFGNYGGKLICADIAKGRIEWQFGEEDGAPFFASAAVASGRVVAGRRDNKIYCLDARSGKRVWTFSTRGDVDSSPVIASNTVIVGSADGSVYAIALATGKLIWSYELGGRITSSPAVDDGRIIIGCEDGRVYALGAKR
ncbi:MAG: PQQ-binding-like beta-propeller repeat protein [Spirochaetota bacterium]